MREEFAGKTGLIVGGSSGIGKTVGRILLERGAEAVIIVGRNEQKLRATELVNSAGVFLPKPFLEHIEEDFLSCYRIRHLGSPAPFGMSMAASWLGATNISWRSVQDHLRRPAMGRNHAAPCAFQNRSRARLQVRALRLELRMESQTRDPYGHNVVNLLTPKKRGSRRPALHHP